MESCDLISVIVPVHNVAPYLQRCVESIQNQTYHKLEIILVDDGSTDGCSESCDSFAKQDNRIIVIHQSNAGVCAARNAALEIVTGQYIMFVDSDDFLHPAICEKLLTVAKTHSAQMTRGSFCSLPDRENTQFPEPSTESAVQVFTPAEALSDFICTPYSDDKAFPPVVWGTLYDRNLFRDLRFPEGFVYEEGFVWPGIIMQCRKLVFLNEKLYGYFINPKGINISSPLTQRLKSREDWKQIYETVTPAYPELKAPAARQWVKKYILLFDKILQDPTSDPDGFYRADIIRSLQEAKSDLDKLLPPEFEDRFHALLKGEEAYKAYLKKTEFKNKVRGKIRMILHK